jgi:uncharacterized membrane protein YhhN
LTAALSLLALASALLCVRAECAGRRGRVYLFKPLTIALVVLIALEPKHAAAGAYRPLVVAGLLCSLAGDVFLMLPRDRFVAGLVCFLFAHLCYVAAFFGDGAADGPRWAALPLAVYGALMLRGLWPRLGRLRGPVVVYVLVILLMAWAATARWLAAGAGGRLAAAAGAWLFVVSDSALALNRFRGEFRGAQAVILSTYFAAQWLIALST